MRKFEGFSARMQFTSIPDVFFSNLLPQIDDINELKVTLYIFKVLYRKRGFPRFVTYYELLGIRSLVGSLGGEGKSPEEVLRTALSAATQRGTLLHLVMDRGGATEDCYFINSVENVKAISKIKNGELNLGNFVVKEPRETGAAERPDIFTLYEDNIGMLTPITAEELRDAEKAYPADWLRDAIKEAVNQNKRSWRYIEAILERWSSEGRGDGAHRRSTEKTDPDKYIKGKYGHMVRR